MYSFADGPCLFINVYCYGTMGTSVWGASRIRDSTKQKKNLNPYTQICIHSYTYTIITNI